jgi:hypothetical protein
MNSIFTFIDNDKNVTYAYYPEKDKIKKYKKDKKIDISNHIFSLLPMYEQSKKSLRQYAKDFDQWCDEIMTIKINDKFSFDPRKCKNLNKMVLSAWLFFVDKTEIYKYEPITQIERDYENKCYNNGIIYCDESIKNKFIETHSYDFNFYFPWCMTSDFLEIPTKAGQEVKLDCLPLINKIQVGYYNVCIQCNNDNFKKMFSFSKYNVYDHKSLYQAMKYKDQFNVSIELITNLKYNALVYDSKHMTTGNKLFGEWFSWLSKLKKAFPKNALVKRMGSSLHGELSRTFGQWVTCKEIEEKELFPIGITSDNRYQITDTVFYGDVEKMYVIDSHRPNKINIRGMKSFLKSFSRNKLSRYICNDLDNVIRINIDSIGLKVKNDKFEKYTDKTFKIEEKSTGKICWLNASKYVKVDENNELIYRGKFSDDDKSKVKKAFKRINA